MSFFYLQNTDILVYHDTDGRVAPRSGLASKNFIDTGAGVIDADYRGPVKVLLFNHSDVDFEGVFQFRSFFQITQRQPSIQPSDIVETKMPNSSFLSHSEKRGSHSATCS